MKTNSIRLIAAAFSLLALSTVYANADIASASVNKIETITVLGAATSEDARLGGINLNQLPLNAHIVGQTEIERIRFVDPNELLDRIPGETQVRNLRIPNGGKSYTLAFVDGVPIEGPYDGATQRLDRVNTFDIKRVEVLKGPASALYPNNVFGGVVNVVTRDIPDRTVAKISAEAGNFGRQRFGFSLGSNLADVGYLLNVNNRRLNGLRDGSQNDRDVASLKLVYDYGEDTQFTTRLEALNEVVQARGDLTAEQIEQDPRQAGSLSSATDFQQDSASIAVRHRLLSGEFNATALTRTKDSVGLSRFRGPQDSKDDATAITVNYRQDLRYAMVVAGVDRYRSDVETKSFDRDDTLLTGAFRQSSAQLDIDAYFAQLQFDVIDDLTVTAGARYEDIGLSSTSYPGRQANFRDLAPKLGVNYQLTENQQLWFSVSEGFYAPDLDDLFDADNGNPNLHPEQSQNIEIGFRGVVGDFAYDSSIYHNEIAQYLVTQEFIDVTGNEFEHTTNAGQVTVKGIESVVEYAPPDARWRIGLTHTYADNHYDSFVQSTPGATDDFSGRQLRRSPKHHLNARIAWEPVSNFTAEIEGDFYSRYFADDANSAEGVFKRGERLNLRLTYQRDHWNFWLNVLNMTNTLEDRATFRRGKLSFRTIDGRSYYAGLSYDF